MTIVIIRNGDAYTLINGKLTRLELHQPTRQQVADKLPNKQIVFVEIK